jgi:hypothetical protein
MKHLVVIAGILVLGTSGEAVARTPEAPADASFTDLDGSGALDAAQASRVEEIVAARAKLLAARNAGLGLTAAGAILMVAGAIAGGVMLGASSGCGTVVNDECSNLGDQMSGVAVLASVVPIGGLLIAAGAPVWGVYQRRLDRFDAVTFGARLVGVGPLIDPRTGTKGLVATFAF